MNEMTHSITCPFSNCRTLRKRQHTHLSFLKLQNTTKETAHSPVLSQTAEHYERDGTLTCPFSNCRTLRKRRHTHLSFLKLQNTTKETAHSPDLSQTAEHYERDGTLTCPFSNLFLLVLDWRRYRLPVSPRSPKMLMYTLASVPADDFLPV